MPSSPEKEEASVRTIPTFSSFRPPSSSSDHQPNGSGRGDGPIQGARPPVPKFSSFRPLIQQLEPSVPANTSRDSGGKVHKHRDRRRSRSRHRDRSRERNKHKSRGSHQSKELRGEYSEDHHRDDSRERNVHRDKRRRRSRERDREGERHKDRESSGNHRSIDDQDLRKRKEPVAAVDAGEILPWDDENPTGTQLFCINTKGDPANLIYGTIHRYSIPQYYRFGKGCVIGLPPAIRIVHDKGDGKGLTLASGAEQYKRGVNGDRRRRFALSDDKGLRRLKIIAEDDGATGKKAGSEFDRGLEYIPLSSRQTNRLDANGRDEVVEDRLLFHLSDDRYQRPEDEDLEYASTSDDEVDEMSAWNSTHIRQKQIEIQRRVDSNPSDTSAWLELVAHQDKVLYAGDGRKKRATIAERKSTAEIKLSILGKAMEKMPQSDHEGKGKLWECWFDVAGETWEPERLLSKYQSTLRQYPTMHSVWVKYLNFRQTDFESFKYTEMIQCYEQCLEVLRTAIHNKDKDDTDIPRLEGIALYVIFRGLHLMREAGYVEISIAALQGLSELNLFAPKSVLKQYPLTSHVSYDSIISEFCEFWDAEVLRAGEDGAQGWSQYVEKGNEGPIPEGARKENGEGDDPDIDRDDPFGWWTQQEIEAIKRRGAWPARIVDEAEEDDPFNVILSNDIMRWMFCISHDVSRKSLIDYVLRFCGLPGCFASLGQDGEEKTQAQFDPFLCGHEMDSGHWFWPRREVKEKLLITWEGMEPDRTGNLKDESFGFKLNGGYPITVDMLFGRQDGGWVYPMAEVPYSKKLPTTDCLMAVRVLKMVMDSVVLESRDHEKLAIFYWALEWRIDPAKAQKIAKKLLKKYRTSLLLYNAYAQIEWRMGNIDVARKVFTTALGMRDSFPERNRLDTIILWKTWAWEELMDGNLREALNVLISIPDGKFVGNTGDETPGSKTALLRVKKVLLNEQDRLASLGLLEHAFAYNEAMALVEYLSSSAKLKTENLDVSGALPIYDSLFREMRDKGLSASRECEVALMNGKIRLLYHHSRTSKLFRMSLLREALEEAIVEVKQSGERVNTLLWSLYAWNEGRSRLDGRVRGWLRDKVIGSRDKNNAFAGYSFAIWAELRMTGDNVHAVRNLFEEAVDLPLTNGSVTLWKHYVEFELREKEPIRAKLVFFRALRCCPWSKDIAMLAFNRLISVLNYDELKKMLSIITTEKELRVCDVTILEDYLEELDDERGQALYPGISATGPAKREIANKLPEDPSSLSEEMETDI